MSTSRYYDAQPGRNGAVFEDAVEAAFVKIAATPRLYPPAHDAPPHHEVREYYLKRFKQRVIYAVRDDDVTIIAVVHASQREDSWHDRLAEPTTTPTPPTEGEVT